MNRCLRWSSLACYVAALTILLVRPIPPVLQPPFPQADKVEHFIAMGLFSVLILRAMTDPRAERLSKVSFTVACLVSVAYAVAMESVQAHVGRDCSVADMLAGALGVAVLTPVYALLRHRSLYLR